MAQFTVYKNKNPGSKSRYPLLVDVQSDLFGDLKTRIVIPLTRDSMLMRKPMSRLTPILEVNGDEYLLITPQLAGIALSELGIPFADVARQRDAIVAALDMLITGV